MQALAVAAAAVDMMEVSVVVRAKRDSQVEIMILLDGVVTHHYQPVPIYLLVVVLVVVVQHVMAVEAAVAEAASLLIHILVKVVVKVAVAVALLPTVVVKVAVAA